ncbi:flagellar basal body L-ring protein FlgH [Methylomonas sp. LW13]|uniref:Flagellar L-ring protein n=1 Tax=Methylomonas defluvii TaxID=3045149 RepID=A0ABU4UL44_9GAMM|nr:MULTISPECIES: flagellar basal body L-ring protein FlgH [unclassified Methylomonas]MDX8130206.1 flagellar basal body L-ring protein FlgH [Methylomonas sp. OY6]NOV32641.1 flagellar basal body L-ring protein FlgH [Methylomonas sp. ZR1]PKD40526.1 flagellar basal body L-ring protein FlgH [Methylomonas sp. Kb3]QBC29005.1 flagellar basal body L-ring protein FlgH [Methylomonas sp. LW13]
MNTFITRQAGGKILLVAAIALLAGCDTLPKRDPDFAPVQPADLRPPQQSNGAIYQAGYDMRLFEDHAARRVGDILTVTFDENTNATKQANSKASKNSDINIKGSAPTLFGVASEALLGHDLASSLEYSTDRSSEGKGDSRQSNRLTGSMSVTVVDVLPNGNLRVRGEKRVTLNDGSEYIRLSGIVRPIDINVANTLASSKVADATIMYTGDGALADSSKPGWISRILSSPLFPF